MADKNDSTYSKSNLPNASRTWPCRQSHEMQRQPEKESVTYSRKGQQVRDLSAAAFSVQHTVFSILETEYV